MSHLALPFAIPHEQRGTPLATLRALIATPRRLRDALLYKLLVKEQPDGDGSALS
ncbi:MAG: hypothetical protein QOF51_3723 [Chloroflexota bacterium]|jgi:hypothetical protein|nr:hypothetical protein [Chloroflexota bacterium]